MTTISKASAGMLATPYDVSDSNTCEDVLPSLRARSTHVKLSEITITQYFAIGAKRLFEDLPTMRDKQQRRTVPIVTQALVVQCGNNRRCPFAVRRYDQMSGGLSCTVPFDVKCVELATSLADTGIRPNGSRRGQRRSSPGLWRVCGR